MAIWLRQSTASQEVLLGTFMDEADGITPSTALTISASDIKLWKMGATSEVNKNSGGATHIAAGRYYAVLDATDSNTLGGMEINVHVAGALPIRRECLVVSAVVYDAIIAGSDRLQVHADEITAGLITAAAIADGAIDRATFAADTGLQTVRSGTAQAGAAGSVTLDPSASSTTDFYKGAAVRLTGGTGDGQTRLVTAYNGTSKVATITPNWATAPDNTSTFAVLPIGLANLVASNGAATPAGAIPNAAAGASGGLPTGNGAGAVAVASMENGALASIWNRLTSDLTTNNSIGKLIVDNLNATVSSRAAASLFTGITSLAQWLGALAGKHAPNSTAQTEINATGAAGGSYDATTDSLQAARDAGGGSGPSAADIRAEMDANSTKLANLDATMSSRLAASSYTAPPSAATTAGAVRTELTTELGRIDAATSSRLAAASYAAPPSAASNASAVRSELATELARVDAAISSRATPAQVNTEADQALADVGLTPTVTGRLDAAVSSRSSHSAADVWAVTVRTLSNGAGVKKNTALAAFPFLMVDELDGFTPEPGLTVTAERKLDAGTFAACANSVTETEDGWYRIDLAAGDLNGDNIVLRFAAAGARTREFIVLTEP